MKTKNFLILLCILVYLGLPVEQLKYVDGMLCIALAIATGVSAVTAISYSVLPAFKTAVDKGNSELPLKVFRGMPLSTIYLCHIVLCLVVIALASNVIRSFTILVFIK